MANIYEEKNEALHTLLDRAKSEEGATVLIPDLQRPYVWTPNQVTLLMDSLIRGWPFGTLLMWKVATGELQNIPHRPFWRVVDRSGNGEGTDISRKDEPASFHMVLDGQQRVQSLLLALGGDGWGFKMEDRDWAVELEIRHTRGRQGRYKHWSKATLCFDLDCFLDEYSSENSLLAVDFNKVLQWVITDSAEGQSKDPKPGNYEEPLLRAFEEKNKARFIRLSRLWVAAGTNPSTMEGQFQKTVKDLFDGEGIPAEKTDKLLKPMGELMATLRTLKLSKVTFLELLAFDKAIWTEDSYNDAIVNIFTRLNTAGRTLTREEITMAWLKTGWDPKLTEDKSAGDCFKELLAEINDNGLKLGMDNLVSAVSFIWAACCNNGQLLVNKDLLRGETIRPMASELAKRWNDIRRALLTGLDLVNKRQLEYGTGGHYSSLNALSVVWAWYYLAFQWESQQKLDVTQKDDFEKKIFSSLASMLDRWLICSQWAGRWAVASAKIFSGYAKALHEDFQQTQQLKKLEEVHDLLNKRFRSFVSELEGDAINFVNNLLSVNTRERVSAYKTALWVWHRLDDKRWEMSKISLRIEKDKPYLDVDHAVAYKLWERKLGTGLPAGITDLADALPLVNMLGNCSLLEKSFNISKSDKTLRSFMEKVHEIKTKKIELPVWAQALGLDNAMVDAEAAATTETILEMIKVRDKAIRAELVEFVKGSKARVDL